MTTTPDSGSPTDHATPAAAPSGPTPEQVKDHENALLRGVLDAWPEAIAGACEVLNELFRQQVVLAQDADPAPMKVKAARADALKEGLARDGVKALYEVLRRIDENNREIRRRVKALRAERDALKTELATLRAAAPQGAPPDEAK